MLTLVLFEHHLITEVAAPGSFTAANVAVADDLLPPMPLHHHLELPHARGFPFCHFPVARSPSFILIAAASPLARAPVSICVSLSLSADLARHLIPLPPQLAHTRPRSGRRGETGPTGRHVSKTTG